MLRRGGMGMICFLSGVCGLAQWGAGGSGYQPTWESLDARPTPEWFQDAKFGIFIHWGLYSVPAWGEVNEYAEWYWFQTFNADGSIKDNPWGRFHRTHIGEDVTYESFAAMWKAELFDPDYWAEIFVRSGARYIVPTSKHHEGFCLWPSVHANQSWGRKWNSVDIGPRRDLLGDLMTAVRKRQIRIGFYYSLYEWFNPLWRIDRARFVDEHMLPQFKDVVSRYMPDIIFADGEWDMSDEAWKSREFLAWLFNESPCREEVVVNDRWGNQTRHRHGGYYTTEYGAGLPHADKPWEECRGMGKSFGYNRNEPLSNYASPRELIYTLVDLVSRGGNFLLDIGPTADGRIPEIMQDRLVAMGDWLRVNGEGIYGTRAWKRTCQWTEGRQPEQDFREFRAAYEVMKILGLRPLPDGTACKEVLFTVKGRTLYAFTPGWPGRQLRLRDIPAGPHAVVHLLGREASLPVSREGGDLIVDLSSIGPQDLPCEHMYGFRISDVP